MDRLLRPFARMGPLVLVFALLVGCRIPAVPSEGLAAAGRDAPLTQAEGQTLPGSSPAPADAPVPPGLIRVFGSLEDAEGRPAGGSRIRIFRDVTLADALVGNAAGGLVANAAGSLAGNAAGSLVSGGTGPLARRGGISDRRTMAVVAETTADADGRFGVEVPDEGRLALLASVDRPSGPLMTHLAGWTGKDADKESLRKLRMTPPGRIEGRVAVDLPEADLLGIDVFVPGTDLIAKTDASGSYAFSRVPAGRHALVAQHPVLGRTGIEGVMVSSNATTRPGVLMIRPERPRVVAVEGLWFPGETIRLRGEGFRLAEGKVPQVFLDGLLLNLVGQGTDSLEVRLPPSWTEGSLLVTVDGRPGEPVAAPAIAWGFAGMPAFAAGDQRVRMPFTGPARLLRASPPTFRLGTETLPVVVGDDALVVTLPATWMDGTPWTLRTSDGQMASGSAPVRLTALLAVGPMAQGLLSRLPADASIDTVLSLSCQILGDVQMVTGTTAYRAVGRDSRGDWHLDPPDVSWQVERYLEPGIVPSSVSIDTKGLLVATTDEPGDITVRATLGNLRGSEEELAGAYCPPVLTLGTPEVPAAERLWVLPGLRLARTAVAQYEAAMATAAEQSSLTEDHPVGFLLFQRPRGIHGAVLPELLDQDGMPLTRRIEPSLPIADEGWESNGDTLTWTGDATITPITLIATLSHPLTALASGPQPMTMLPRFRVQFLGQGWPMAQDQISSTIWKNPFPISLVDASGKTWSLPQTTVSRYRSTTRGVDQPRITWTLPAGTYTLRTEGSAGSATQSVDIGPAGRTEWGDYVIRVPWPG